VPGYLYSIDNGATFQTSNTFTNLCAGTYDGVIQDTLGCTYSDSIVLVVGSSFSIDSLTLTGTSCPITCDGVAAVFVSGGTGPYSYSWDSIPPGTSSFDNSLCVGNHTITITDALGCTADSIFAIGTLSSLAINSVTSTPSGCFGSCTGTITVAATGVGLTYSLDTITYQASNSFTNVCAGQHLVFVQDTLGCTDTMFVTVSGGMIITPTVPSDTSVCVGACFQLTAAGLASYTWTPSAGLSDPTIANPIACPPSTTTYCVTGTDSAGCPADTACVTITVLPPPSFSVSMNVTINYLDSTILCAFPLTGPYVYQWSNGVNTACQTVAPDSTTTYVFTITDFCGNSYTDSVTVTVLGGIGFDEVEEAWLHYEIYPNPTQQNPTLALDITQAAKVKLRLTDVLGRTVYSPQEFTLSAGHYQLPIQLGAGASSGVYILQMEINGALHSTNIIKQSQSTN
jgi:hypothetical protein